MAVAIRLKRAGRRHRPFYRIEAIEKRNARDGRSLETVGTYDPFAAKPEERVRFKLDRLRHWLDQGARPSATVTSFLRKVDVQWAPKVSRRTAQRRRKKQAGKQE